MSRLLLAYRLRLAPAPVSSLRLRAMSSANTTYEHILTSRPAEGVALITLNRPKALNALSTPVFTELNDAVAAFDRDDAVRALVLTGSERAFAAGADIKEMKDKEYSDVFKNKFLESWSLITQIRKPIIAAVSGYALGGGCELAMMCDIILASPTAVFGQPEINIGVVPGGGGTQRLARAIGKSRTMELTLTGRNFTAAEAADWGLVSRVSENVLEDAIAVAATIASKSAVAVQAGKEAVNVAYETTLAEGLRYERRIFHGLFATHDQKEGMAAFAEKRKPTWTHS
ncbi:enoyl-CoA hydratase [Rhodofomes roseus]|uniref:Enoyl-CoA hydratase n=1 Tax=Rhodofomes roseus TaxID=34475 RepID=A0ABQ8K4B6_9APHY|nr:enoyl-CoA hydratase [Rhodofomes roseus]KAH9831744.1 enoyl-CoA hydratase [Rhodofomes roseus]